jgi:hypothetical protein
MARLSSSTLLLVLLVAVAAVRGEAQPAPAGDYLGQTPPGRTPQLFAPGIVSTGLDERDLVITPDGNEIYFSVVGPNYAYATIMVVKRADGRWGSPQAASFSGNPQHMDIEPAISPDGKRLFFMSKRPLAPGSEPNEDIWVVDRTPAGWSEARNLGAPICSSEPEFFPSVTRDGTLYFTRRPKGSRAEYIYRSRLVDGKFAEPERLPVEVNSGETHYNAFVAPDESYIILGMEGRKDAIGPTDYHVAFRKPDGGWYQAVNLGQPINLPGVLGYSPSVSPEGKYFFFMSHRVVGDRPAGRLSYADYQRLAAGPGNGLGDVWWVDAAVITDLRPK